MRELGWRIARLGISVALSGCAAQPDGSSAAPMDPSDSAAVARAAPSDAGEPLTLAFAPMYSAYDGVHDFRVPLRVEGASGPLTVTTEPADFVSWAAAVDGLILDIRRAGSATLVVEDAQGHRASTELFVSQADPREWELGHDRYYHEVAYETGNLSRWSIWACHDCHGEQRLTDPAVDASVNRQFVPTPQQLAGYSDEILIALLEAGQKLPGSPFRALPRVPSVSPQEAERIQSMFFHTIHARTRDLESVRSILVFLRSLPPEAQPPLDFGGLTSP